MFDPNITIGTVLSEKDIHRIFRCQTTFGIRLNRRDHLIVIVSDATSKNKYSDHWKDDILYYTGTDAGSIDGNQTLTGSGNNNGNLRDVWFEHENPKTTLFLFVKYVSNQCTYKGIVELASQPYESPREDDPTHTVWKFPLRLLPADVKAVQRGFEYEEHLALGKDLSQLRRSILTLSANPNATCKNQRRTVVTRYYERSPLLSAYVKKRCNGICDLCGCNAPFTAEDGSPYLESHHITWLSNGGEDVLDNLVALCPNCHRKMHILNAEEDVQRLIKKVEAYKKRGL